MIKLNISQPYKNGVILEWTGISAYPRYTLSTAGFNLIATLEYASGYKEEFVLNDILADLTVNQLTINDDGSLVWKNNTYALFTQNVPISSIKLSLGGTLDGIPWGGPIGNYVITGLHTNATILYQQDNLINTNVEALTLGTYYKKPLAEVIYGPKDNLTTYSSYTLSYGYPWYWEMVHVGKQLQIRVYKITDNTGTHIPIGSTAYTPQRKLMLVKSIPYDVYIFQASVAFSQSGLCYIAYLTTDKKLYVVNNTGQYVPIYEDQFKLTGVNSMYLLDTSIIYKNLVGNMSLLVIKEDLTFEVYDLDIPRSQALTTLSLTNAFIEGTLRPVPWIIDKVLDLPDQIVELAIWSREYGFRYLKFYVTDTTQFLWLSDTDTNNIFWSGDLSSEEYDAFWQR